MKLESQIRSSYVLWALAFLFLLSSIPAFAQAPAPSRAATVFDSMPQAKKIDQVTISPDGTRVAYIVGDELSLISLNGGPARPIAVEGKLPVRDVSWSADSKQLAFIADLPGSAPSAQVWTASTNDDSSAPAKRAELNGYVENPRFSPDGSRLAVLFIESMPRVAGPLQPMTPLAGVIDEKTYEQRLALIDLSKNDLSTNAPAQVSPADLYIYEYDWTPDGKYVAFIEGLMSDEGSTGGDVYVVPIAGGTARNLTPNFKGSPSSLAWTEPGSITFLENVDGQSGFGQVNLKGAVRALWTGEEFVATTVSFSRDGGASAVIRESASTPPNVWAGPIGQWKQLTTLNSGVKPAWGEMRNFHWTNGSTRLQGWLMLPKDFAPGKKYPLIVNVHGGPSAMCTPHWDAKILGPESAMGYFAFCPNPRGSYGQGEAFTQGNVKDFGGGDFRDIMAGVDAISRQYPIDAGRIGIRGHSYGGYMTMWAETKTQRFAAAVAGAGLSDWLSYSGVNDIDEWMIPFFGASVYDDPAVYAKSDPMHFVKKVKTPTLILVGDSDGEVPMEQSVEWWHALKTLNVPVRLVVYPNEGHMLVKPADARDYFVRTLEWFDQWFEKASGR